MAEKEIHMNHRQRMRDKFRREGITAFEDHEILEMLLFYTIPRVNTNHIAHNLLKTIGSMSGIFDATPSELCRIDGVGKCSAEYICYLGEIFRNMTNEMLRSVPVENGDSAGVYALLMLKRSCRESAVVVYLDDIGIRIYEEWLSDGYGKSAEVLCKNVMGTAKDVGASGIIIAHNHISEPSDASSEDLVIAEMLRKEAAASGIRSLYNVIVTDDKYVLI